MNAQAAQADRDFRDALAKILGDRASLQKYSLARREYVRYAHDAMSWWIDDEDKAGCPIEEPEDMAPRDRIILAWAKAKGVPMKGVRAAIKAQADHMRNAN